MSLFVCFVASDESRVSLQQVDNLCVNDSTFGFCHRSIHIFCGRCCSCVNGFCCGVNSVFVFTKYKVPTSPRCDSRRVGAKHQLLSCSSLNFSLKLWLIYYLLLYLFFVNTESKTVFLAIPARRNQTQTITSILFVGFNFRQPRDFRHSLGFRRWCGHIRTGKHE